MLSLLEANWNKLIVFATSLVALLSPFVMAPPYGLEKALWYKFGIFFVALCTGLWLIPMKRWSFSRSQIGWWVSSVALTIASTGVFLNYTSLLDRWTLIFFNNHRIVIGQTLTEAGTREKNTLIHDGDQVDDLRLLRSADGDAYAIWLKDEILHRSRSLTVWYLGSLFLLSSAAINFSQAIYCASSRNAC